MDYRCWLQGVPDVAVRDPRAKLEAERLPVSPSMSQLFQFQILSNVCCCEYRSLIDIAIKFDLDWASNALQDLQKKKTNDVSALCAQSH